MAWSLIGLEKALRKVSVKSVEFHNARGDFEMWAEKSLHDKTLAGQLKKVRVSRPKGETLVEAVAKIIKERFEELSKQAQAATRYF
jgi:hypothetical protein